MQIGVIVAADLDAGAADATCVEGLGFRPLAQQPLGEQLRGRELAHGLRAHEQHRVRQTLSLEQPVQLGERLVLAHQSAQSGKVGHRVIVLSVHRGR